ncbi:carboxypeptidase regulatory-like domain-containing protein [Fulvivirgaceae bacterium BMA10]|uniref:Carboxypeptidase regulatory-like domain-containing protein n=1 Tax=Splendidivirga corallicola TaxID=3051826 RepID=A0ABT8KGJ6_9BACT|nr:carboxypeptidase regulatory-like domain-containing protein [Fulvivirgaceae bacterium BMA10]
MKKNILTLSLLFAISLCLSFIPAEQKFLPTSLRITIINELGNVEEGAKVILYKSKEDYNQEKNAIGEPQTTDKKGRVTFKKLEPVVYFVHAEKGDRNNYGAGVQTDTLQEGRINKVNIVIE